MNQMCAYFDKSRQAYYKGVQHEGHQQLKESAVLDKVHQIRRVMPELGGRKLHHLLEGQIGRDRFFDLLRANDLLIERRKRFCRTTDSNHSFRRYSNLIEEYIPTYAGEVLVSDITYLRTLSGFVYLFLVTDLYSRKIVGYHVSRSLGIEGAKKALKMALKQCKNCKIHHSDRGIQYCCKQYTHILRKKGISISMTESYDPYQNAVAERVNGILKYEFYLNENFMDLTEAMKSTFQAVHIYNRLRPHLSLDYQTPESKFSGYVATY